jgi:hypothetical protein
MYNIISNDDARREIFSYSVNTFLGSHTVERDKFEKKDIGIS